MIRTRYTAEHIICNLKITEQLFAQGRTVAGVFSVIEVAQPIYHRCSQLYGRMHAKEAWLLTQLGKEHARLKNPLAEAELGKAMLKDLAEGSF